MSYFGRLFEVLVTCLGVLSLTGCPGHGARILLSSEAGSGSHFSVLSAIGKGLARNNHEVTALISSSYSDKAQDERYSHLHFDIFADSTTATTKDWSKWVMKHLLDSRHSLFGNLQSLSPRAILGLLTRCSELLDHALERKRHGVEYDLLIIDAHMGCSMLLAGILDTPYVLLVPSGIKPSLARRYGASDTTAYYPEMSSGLPYQMNFVQRFANTLAAMSMDLSVFFTYDVYSFCFSFKYELTVPIAQVMSNAQLIFINSDFAVDFPFPLLPNVVTVGGLTSKDAEPLDKEWTSVMESASADGVVLFTLGTYIMNSVLSKDVVEILARAFSALPQTVIWQTTEKIPASVDIASNTKVVPWMPQNDLLGHPKVVALVFHGGNNGMYEAVYHNVPMVIIPLVLDTPDVAARVVHRKMGLSIDLSTMTSDGLANAINTVITDPSFKANTQRASAIMKERPHPPLDRAVHWIDHVLKYGGDYLRPSSCDLYFWQLYLLDVYAAMALLAYVIYRAVKYTVGRLRSYMKRRRGQMRTAYILPFMRKGRITRRQRLMLVIVTLFLAVYCLLYYCVVP